MAASHRVSASVSSRSRQANPFQKPSEVDEETEWDNSDQETEQAKCSVGHCVNSPTEHGLCEFHESHCHRKNCSEVSYRGCQICEGHLVGSKAGRKWWTDEKNKEIEILNHKIEKLEDLNKENQEDSVSALCIVCMDKARDIILFPCLHLALCCSCWEKHKQKIPCCLVCQYPTSSTLKVIVP